MTYHSAGNARHEHALWQVHRVSNRQDDQLRVFACRPIKDVVHDRLLSRPKQVQLEKQKRGMLQLTGEQMQKI